MQYKKVQKSIIIIIIIIINISDNQSINYSFS